MSAGEIGSRPAWTEFRQALERIGFRPSRRLGQNFLLDENMVRAIVRDAALDPSDTVLEVGPGCGFLTRHLASEVAELVCVEVDERLLGVARTLCAPCGNIRWLHADVLASKHALDPRLEALLPTDRPWKVVANLPYSVSAPLLVVLSALAHPPTSMTVLVQQEVAARIAALPGTRAWGPLSIRLQLDHAVRLGRQLSAQLFWPRPEVESTLVHLDRRAANLSPDRRRALDVWVGYLFQRRRQALGRVLAEHIGRERTNAALVASELESRVRAEDLDLTALCRLVLALEPGALDPNTEPPEGPS